MPRCWTWLEGSDEQSQVRGLGPSGHLVYDVPDKNAALDGTTVTETLPDRMSVPDSMAAQEAPLRRKLVLATIQGEKLSFQDLAFDPTVYSFFVWGERGVWGLKYEYGYVPPETSGLRNDYMGYDIDYQAYNSPEVRHVTIPFQAWQIMELSPGGDAMLVGAPVYQQSLTYTTMNLYLREPDGSRNGPPIYNGLDSIKSAHFSPDQNYVLLNTYRPTNNYRDEIESVVLLDLRSGKQFTLAQQQTGADTGRGYPAVAGTFLTGGALKGKILLFGWYPEKITSPVMNSGVFSLIDPAKPGIVMTSVQSNRYPVGPVWVSEGEGGKCLVVVWQNGLGDAGKFAEAATAVKLEPGQPGSAYTFELNRSETLTGAWLRDGNLVFTTNTPTKSGRGPGTVSAYSARLMGAPSDGSQKAPATLYRFAYQGPQNFTFGTWMNTGSQLFAYVDDGQLHVHSYDGSIDLSLESGVADIYTFPYMAVHWLK
jgi:hypothetical protein